MYGKEELLPPPPKKNISTDTEDELLPPPPKKKVGTVATSTGEKVSSPTQSKSLFGNFGTKDEYIAANPVEQQVGIEGNFTGRKKRIKSVSDYLPSINSMRQPAVKDETFIPKPITDADVKEKLASTERHNKNVQDAIDNTTEKYFKIKGINAPKGSALYNEQKAKVEKMVANKDATYHMGKDGKPGLDRSMGWWEGITKGWDEAMNAEDEAEAFTNMTTKERIEYANKKIEEKPPSEYIGEQYGLMGSAGHLLSSSAPFLAKATGGAILGTMTGGTGAPIIMSIAATAPDMINQGMKDEVLERYQQLKKENPNVSDEENMKIAEGGMLSGGVQGAAENLLFIGTGLKAPLSMEGKMVLGENLTKTLTSSTHVGLVTGAVKAAGLAERKAEGYDIKPQEIINESVTTAVDNFTGMLALNGLLHGITGLAKIPKNVLSAFKYGLKDVPTSDIQAVLKANEKAGKIPEGAAELAVKDIEDYKSALAKTSPALTPESQASVAGLMQARDYVESEMQSKDITQREPYAEKINWYNEQIKKITETNEPLKYEVDDVTGKPLGEPPTKDTTPEEMEPTTTDKGVGEAGSGVGGDVLKGVNDKMRQTELEMEFKGNDAELSFKNNDVEIVVAKPIGADGKYSVTVSEKSDSNTGFTLNEGKTKLFDTKLEALEYAKKQKEQSLSTPKGKEVVQPSNVGGEGVVDKTEPKTEPITNEKETTQDTNKTKVEGKEQPLVTDPTSKGETGKTEAEVRKAIEEAAASKKSENGKKVAMEEEAAKHGKVGEKVLADIRKEAEPPENNDSNENNGNEDWTHINKKDITEAEDLASKHPFGESETWKNSVKKGLDKLAKVAKKGESLYDAAKNKVNEWAAKVKQEILDDGKSTFNPSDEEIAQMAYHRTMTNKRIAELEPDLTSPIQAVRDAAEIVLGDLEAQKEMVDYVLHNTATTAGRAFNIRQMVSKIDAENGLQVKRMDVIRKQKGQPLSEKQEQELRDIHDEEVKNQKAKDEYAQKKAEKDFEEAVKLEVDRRMKAKKDKAASDKTNKPPTEKRAKIADKLNEWADKFEKFGRADLPDGTVKNSLGPDVQKMVSNAMRFVAEGVRDGKNIPEILKDAVKKFGESVLDHIKGGLRDIGITDREIEGDRQYALNEIKKLADKEKSDMLTKSAVGKGLVRELVNSHIDNGLTGKDVFTELNKDLKEIFPEITEQQVRDAYLKEGEFTLDKKENINKAKVDAKNELRSIAKNETDIADLKAERDLRKREREERQKTNYENQLIAEKKGLTDKKALTEKQEARLVELNKELDRIKQRKEKDAKVSNPKDLNRSDKEKAVLDEIKKEKEQWAKEKQAQRDLEVAAKKAQTAAKNEADRLKALTEKRDRLQKGQRDVPSTSTPKVESPAIEQVKAEIKEADKKLREAESEANRLNKEMQVKKDKLAEHEANIKRAENGLESIKTNRKKSDRQIDTDIADAETRLKKELNKQGLKLEKGSKAEKEQKQKVADKHNERADKLIESIDTKLQDATLTAPEKAALENAKKILEKSKINPDSALDVFDAVDKAEKNTELARAELANSDKLSDIKREIANSQIQMGRDKLQTEQDILLQRHKDSLQKKIDENERKIEAGEFVEKEPARLKTSDAESVRLEIKDRETKNKFNALGKKAQREAMTKREKVIDTIQSLYVIGLVGRLSTLAKVGVSALTKQPLNTITSQTFGRLGSLVFPKINNALRGEGNEGWRKEKNRYMAHYGALGKEGMAKLISKGKENAQKADEAYINAKDKLEDIANKYGKDSKQYKDFEKGEFKKAEDKQKQALLDNVTNSIYEWIGGNAWGDAAEVFLHSSAKLEQLLGKGEKEMWADKTRKEKIMFVLSTSAATHGVLKNFSARAEFAANFVARLENKMKQGIDISKAEEILKTVNESYIAFQRGKYQEDNAITGGFKAGLEGLQRWAERHPDYKYAADLMAGALKFKNPIVRTPLNIAREAIVEYTIGVPLAIAKYRNSLKDARVDAKQFDLAGQEMKDHMKKFMDNIPADKADFIYRAFRKGGFGLGVMALTAMGGIQFGGFFNRDEKRRKKGDELGINEVEIGGQKLTHLQAKIFEHTSAFFPALLWSNYDRVRDENLKAGHGELGANLDAVMKDFQGMIDQIPIGNEMQNPLQGVQIPLIGPFLTEYAEATDVDANGEQIKRKPKGNPLEKVWQNIEMKIPGLRQNVPVSGKSSNWTEEDLKKPILKTFADKGAAKPDYTPSKISIKYVNGKPTQHLDSQTPEIQGLYIKNHQANYELELSKLSNGAYKVYKKPDGSVHIKGENTDEKGSQYTQFKDLTDEQVQYLEGQITRRATIKTKKQLHFQLDDTEKK